MIVVIYLIDNISYFTYYKFELVDEFENKVGDTIFLDSYVIDSIDISEFNEYDTLVYEVHIRSTNNE